MYTSVRWLQAYYMFTCLISPLHAVIAHCFNHYASVGAAWVFQNCLHRFTYISLIFLKIIPLLLYSITCQSHNRHVQVVSIPFYVRYLFFTFVSSKFGDSQQLRLVRILRSTVMVRVGGGWMALDEFLVKNDPCRGKHSVVWKLNINSHSHKLMFAFLSVICCYLFFKTTDLFNLKNKNTIFLF